MALPFGDHDDIFNANAKFAWDVDARLDGKDHAGLKPCLASRCDPGRFMNLQPQSMACTVGEIGAQTGLLQGAEYGVAVVLPSALAKFVMDCFTAGPATKQRLSPPRPIVS